MRKLISALIISFLLITVAIFITSCQSNLVSDVVFASSANTDKLTIITVTPQGTVTEETQSDVITVSFNQAMVPLSPLPGIEPSGMIKFNPEIKGKFRWQGTSTLTFIPDNTLPYATRVEATVPAGIKSLSGNVLEKDYTWKFETLRPQVVDFKPSGKEIFGDIADYQEVDNLIRLDGPIYILFNQAVEAEKTIDYIDLKLNGKNVPLTVEKPSTNQEIDKDWDVNNIIAIKPVNKLNPSSTYILNLHKNLPGKTGNLGLKDIYTIKFKTEAEFAFSGIDDSKDKNPEQDISFNFTNPVAYSELIKNIQFIPKVEFPEYYSDYGISYNPYLFVSLLARTNYKVKISKNMKDIFGNMLGKDIEYGFNTTDYTPSIFLEEGIGTIESNSPRQYPVCFMNLDKVKVQMAPLSKDQVIHIFKKGFDYKEFKKDSFYTVNRIWNLDIPRNQFLWRPLNLDEVLKGRKTGFIFLQIDTLRDMDYDARYNKAFVQVSNLGVTGKFGPDKNLISVNTLDKVSPVENAQVEIRNDKNKIVWTGTTLKDGTVYTPGMDKLCPGEENKMVWIFVTKDDDTCVINSSGNWSVPTYNFNIYNYYPSPGDFFKAYIFTEKGVYRGGEKVHLKGTFREKINGKWQISFIKKLDLKVYNSRGEVIFKKEVSLSDFGSFDSTVLLPKDIPTGRCAMKLYGNVKGKDVELYYGNFLVEDYEPAQFEVTVNSDRDEYVYGDTFQGNIKGWYLFGAPMKGEKVNWYFYLTPTYYIPPGHDEFDFGIDPDTVREGKYIGQGNGELKENGEVAISGEIKEDANLGPYNLSIQGTVVSESRQSVSGYRELLVHPGCFYIGIKPSHRFLSAGNPQKFEVIALSPDGKSLEGKNIKIDILKRQWHSIRKAGLNGKSVWSSEKEDEVLKTFNVTSNKEPSIMEFTPEKSGLYVIRTEGTDDKKNIVRSESVFYVSGKDYVAWARHDDDSIDMVMDKKEYKPGDTAKILIKSPYEKAKALVTIERESIIKSFFVELKGTAETIELPITSDYLPNVFVSVILYQGRISKDYFSEFGEDLGKPSFKIGYIEIPVIPDEKRLKVIVKTDKDNYEPGKQVTVNLHMENSRGKGVKGEVCLSAVDVGVLNLTNFTTPDYFDNFYGPMYLYIETAETRLNVIGQRKYGQKVGYPGGDGGPGGPSGVRDNFVATAYFNPSIVTDENGNASIKFNLPDNITSFLIMATGQTKDSSFGSGEKRIVSKKPLLLKPSIPRFARLNDRFKAGVLVFNGTDKEQEATIEAKSKGVKLLDSETQKVTIPSGQEKEVLFSFEANELLEGKVTFSAAMGAYDDAILHKIPVKAPLLTEAVATSGSSEETSEEKISVPSDIDPIAGHMEINTSSTAMIDLKGGLEYLVDYPYDCLEQKLSRILPLIMAEDLINSFNLSPLKGDKLRRFVQENLKKIKNHQRYSGGFTLWEDGKYESPYLSVYAMYAMAKAQKSGYKVDNKLMSEGKKYLKKILRYDKNDKGWNYPYGEKSQLTTKCFALYTLYLLGEGEPSYLHTLYENRAKIGLFGQSMLLRAMHIYGKDKEEERLFLQELMNNLKLTPTSAHFEDRYDKNLDWIYDTTVRTTALTLQTIIEIDPAFPHAHKVVKWMIDAQKAGRWDTTQENIFAFDALRTYFNKYEKISPDFKLVISLDGKELMKNIFKGRDTKYQKKEVPMSEIVKGKDLSLMFNKDGPGRMYYTIRLIYGITSPVPAKDEGISVFKSIEPLEGSKTKDEPFKAGNVYKVTISVVTPQDRNFVVLNDPVPAGFEVINESFSTENKQLLEKLWKIRDDENTCWWGTFDHMEMYNDRVLLFADQLNPGEHNFTYFVRAIHYGTFSMPPTKAEMMYEPEVFGYSGQEIINIVEK